MRDERRAESVIVSSAYNRVARLMGQLPELRYKPGVRGIVHRDKSRLELKHTSKSPEIFAKVNQPGYSAFIEFDTTGLKVVNLKLTLPHAIQLEGGLEIHGVSKIQLYKAGGANT